MLLRFLHLGMQCRIIKIKKYKEIVKLLWLYYLQSKIKKKQPNPTFCKRKSSYPVSRLFWHIMPGLSLFFEI